jgi:hypothetical protein
MRHVLERIYTYEFCGTRVKAIAQPNELINHALAAFVASRSTSYQKTSSTLFPTYTSEQIATIASMCSEALNVAHTLLNDSSVLIALSSLLFAGGTSDFVWRDRSFISQRNAMHEGLGLAGESKKTPNSVRDLIARTKEDERRMLVDVMLATWCEFGIINWRDDLWYTRTFDSVVIPYQELPYLIADSMLRKLTLPTPIKPVGARIMFGKLYDYVEQASQHYARELNGIATTVYYAGRIVDIVTHSLRGTDPAIPRAPYAPLANAVNFIAEGPVSKVFIPTEALLLGDHVTKLTKALSESDVVRVRTVSEFVGMFDIRRIRAIRSNQVVMTTVTRRYADNKTPARMFDTVQMEALGMVGVSPAETISTVPAADQLADATLRMLDDILVTEAASTLASADAVRLLVSPLGAAELQAIAACIAGEVEYASDNADADASFKVQYVFRTDTDLTGWEDLTTTAIDGLAVTDTYSNVLRLCKPREASGAYAVGDGLADVMSRGARILLLEKSVKKAWLDGGDTYDLQVKYPKYEYDATYGMRVKGIDTSGVIQMNAFSLMGMAPLKSHSIVLSPTTRARLKDQARMFAFVYKTVAQNTTTADQIIATFPGVGDSKKMFSDDDVGVKRRTAALHQVESLFVDAIVKFVTSPVMRNTYAQAVIKAGGRAQSPTTSEEATAYLETTEQFVGKYVSKLLGLPSSFTDAYNLLRGSDLFQRLALLEILHTSRGQK